MTKNIRVSLYIFIPVLLWMLSGFLVNEVEDADTLETNLFKVGSKLSNAISYQPSIKLKATSRSEARVNVRAKTSGEVVKIGATQGQFINKGSPWILLSWRKGFSCFNVGLLN